VCTRRERKGKDEKKVGACYPSVNFILREKVLGAAELRERQTDR
jgi:hypothetical protein